MLIDFVPEIQAFFGSDATPGGIRWQMDTKFKPNVQALKAARDRGIDCKDVIFPALKPGGPGSGWEIFFSFTQHVLHILEPLLMIHTELAAIMGSDCTPNGIKFQFTDRYKPIARKQLEMKASGLDPKDVLDHVKGAAASRGQTFEFSSLLRTSRTHHTDNPQTSASISVVTAPEEALDSNSEPSRLTRSLLAIMLMLAEILRIWEFLPLARVRSCCLLIASLTAHFLLSSMLHSF